MTAFCAHELSLAPLGKAFEDLSFFVDGNSKITCSNGSYANPSPNAFSLPHISSCPGSTPICRASCYVHGLQKNAPELHARYSLNAAALGRVLMSSRASYEAADLLGAWIEANCPGGFRWHVSGDVMHMRHAAWIVNVCEVALKVPFWIYTRSLELAGVLATAPNLAVNVSADSYNYAEARHIATEQGLRLCYLSHDGMTPADLAEGDVVFPDYPHRGRSLPTPTDHAWWQSLTSERRRAVCPADFFGQSEHHRCGPCNKCLTPKEAAT
jgi:hypothetical protein